MGTIVIRSRNQEELDPMNPLHRMQLSIPWPEGGVSAYRRMAGDPWEFTTTADILRRKREKMESRLREKREHRAVHRRALYVWVFWCPGISGCYEGWWVYLIGNKGIESGKYLERDAKMMARIMELFPVAEPDLFATDTKEWKRNFVRQYQRGAWCGKPQGKAPVWAEVKNGSIERLLERVEWPR